MASPLAKMDQPTPTLSDSRTLAQIDTLWPESQLGFLLFQNKNNENRSQNTVHVQKCWHQKCWLIHPMFKCVDTFSGFWNRKLHFFYFASIISTVLGPYREQNYRDRGLYQIRLGLNTHDAFDLLRLFANSLWVTSKNSNNFGSILKKQHFWTWTVHV